VHRSRRDARLGGRDPGGAREHRRSTWTPVTQAGSPTPRPSPAPAGDSGSGQADGFSLNVSNFATTADYQTYGDSVSAALGGKQCVIDVPRNGRGAPDAAPASIDAWCNPPGVAPGENPRIGADRALAVGTLWIKEPGASDGNCRDGEPPAGQFWPDYALRLIQQRP